jgi:hypothetical protein
VAQTTIAYKKREQPAPDISRLEKTVQQDPTNTEAVLQLYQARRDLGIPVEQMANEFAHAATIPVWLDSAIVIGTLFKLQPVLGTYADSVMRHADKTLFNKLWYTLPLAERVETNRVIISRTGAKAAAEKNTKLALRNASFAAGVMDNAPPLERTQTFNSIMAAYFRNVKDTLTYLKSIEGLMRNYYMLLDADSVKRADSAARLLAFNKLLPIGAVDTVFTPRPVESPASFVPRAQFFAGAINTYCWDIYKMKPNSPLAQKATGWAAHGLRIYESAELYDTYARLLYTNGRKEEAIAAQVKAIAAAQLIQKTSVPNFEKVLNAMKANEPIIDLE